MSKLTFLLGAAISMLGSVFGQSLEGEFRKEGREVRASYDEITKIFQASSAVLYEEIARGYGVVMSAEGDVLVKTSEFDLLENPSVVVAKKRYRDYKILAASSEWDVTLLRITGGDFEPITFAESEPSHGTIVLSNSSSTRLRRRTQLGVIAANARAVGKGDLAVLGIAMTQVDPDYVRVDGVSPLGGAHDGGILKGDQLLAINGHAVTTKELVPDLLDDKKVGDIVEIVVSRKVLPEEPSEPQEVEDPFLFVEDHPAEVEELTLEAELRERQIVFPEQRTRNDMMSGEFSERRTNFPRVLQHDTSLAQRTVGGPLVTLDGNCVGMNIAFASRECSYAIPAKELKELHQELLSQANL